MVKDGLYIDFICLILAFIIVRNALHKMRCFSFNSCSMVGLHFEAIRHAVQLKFLTY